MYISMHCTCSKTLFNKTNSFSLKVYIAFTKEHYFLNINKTHMSSKVYIT